MKFETNTLNIFNGCVTIPVPCSLQCDLQSLQERVSDGKSLQVEIDVKRKKRSLNANAYLWTLLGKMADVLKTDKDSLYLIMLERYGLFFHTIIRPSAVERFKRSQKLVRELGPVKVNGQEGIQFQCYVGSSNYNSKEFSVLLDGVIDEAKAINVEVISEADKQLMLQEWGR